MHVSCDCRAVAFETPTPAPLTVYHCHCTQCRRQSSTAFGTSAIFPAAGIFPLSPELRDKMSVYTRPGTCVESGYDMECYFCKTCGSRVMHRILDEDGTGRETVSVKGGLVQGLDWSTAKHIYTASAVVPIPEGRESYPGAPPEREGRKTD